MLFCCCFVVVLCSFCLAIMTSITGSIFPVSLARSFQDENRRPCWYEGDRQGGPAVVSVALLSCCVFWVAVLPWRAVLLQLGRRMTCCRDSRALSQQRPRWRMMRHICKWLARRHVSGASKFTFSFPFHTSSDSTWQPYFTSFNM